MFQNLIKLLLNVSFEKKIRCGNFILDTNTFVETLPNGVKYLASYKKKKER